MQRVFGALFVLYNLAGVVLPAVGLGLVYGLGPALILAGGVIWLEVQIRDHRNARRTRKDEAPQ